MWQKLPSEDGRDIANTVFDTAVKHVLDITAALQAIAEGHVDRAPISSLRVLQLNHAIARTVVDWIEQWSR